MSKIPEVITKEFLREHPECIFVFGDNAQRVGHGGAAALRDEPNTYGFITKKFPDNRDISFFRPKEYRALYLTEIDALKEYVISNPDSVFLISKLGAGLANKYKIWEEVIEPNIKKDLAMFPKQVIFLW